MKLQEANTQMTLFDKKHTESQIEPQTPTPIKAPTQEELKLGEQALEENMEWRKKLQVKQTMDEQVLAQQQSFLKEMKNFKLNFSAVIERTGLDTIYYSEFKNKKYKRVLIKHLETSEYEIESKIPDAEFLPKFLESILPYAVKRATTSDDLDNIDLSDFDFNFEHDITLGLDIDDNLNEVGANDSEDDTVTFLKQWQTRQQQDVQTVTKGSKQSKKYKVMLDAIEEEVVEDAIEEDNEVLSEIDVVDDIDSVIKAPKQEYLTKPYYIDGYCIDYDFITFVPAKNKKENISYGDKHTYEYYSSLINKILNFDYKSSKLDYTGMGQFKGNSYTIRRNIITTKSGTEIVEGYYTLRGESAYLKYTCNDLTITLDLIAPPLSPALQTLPYTVETLDSTKKAVKDAFKNKTQGCTLVLPHMSKFRSILNLEYVPKSDYEVLDTINKIIDFNEELKVFGLPKLSDGSYDMNAPRQGVAAGDAETTGLEVYERYINPDKLVTWQISLRDHQSYSIPFRMRYCQNVNMHEAFQVLKWAFETLPWLCHNIQADASFLASEGILLNAQEDSMHLVGHLCPFIKKHGIVPFSRSLDDIVFPFNGHSMIDLDKYVFKPLGISFDYSLLSAIYEIWYGCPDTDQMRLVWKCLRPKLNPIQESAYRTHVRYARDIGVLSQYTGVGINIDNIKALRKQAVAHNEMIENKIYDFTQAPRDELVLTSPVKLSDYLFGKRGIPTDNVKKNEKSGKPSADKHTIEMLAKIPAANPHTFFKEDIVVDEDAGDAGILKADDLNKLAYPECKLMRIWADNNKNITAFFNGYILNSKDGIYPPHFRTGETDTYRDTERSQITKKTAKKEIGSYDVKTHDDLSADYMAEEFRVASFLSKDDRLSVLLTDPEVDPHTMVTAELDNVPQYAVDHDRRGEVKKCNFGIIYGMKERTLAKNLNNTLFPTDEQIAKAAVLYDDYCHIRAELLAGLEVSRKAVRDKGYVYNALGYRMAYADVLDVDDMVYQMFDATQNTPLEPHIDPNKIRSMTKLMTVAGNAPIQSLAAGILKESYTTLCGKLRERGLTTQDMAIPLVIHDEINAPYNRNSLHFAEIIELVKSSFETDLPYLQKDIDVRLFIGTGFDKFWGKAKADDHELPVRLQEKLIKEFHEGKLLSKEEYGDKVEEYTIQLKKDWLQERLAKFFEEDIEKGVIERYKFVDKLNHELFVQGQVKDMFKLKKKLDKKDQMKNVEVFLEIALDYYGKTLDDVTIIDGDPIVEEKVEKGFEDGMYEIYYTNLNPDRDGYNHFLPHERFKKISLSEIEFDITDLPQPIIDNLTEYFKSISNPNYDIHNSQLVYLKPNSYDRQPIMIKTVPLTLDEDIKEILKGKKLSYSRQEQKTIIYDSSELLYYMQDNMFILSQKVLNQYSVEFQRQLMSLLMSVFIPRKDVYNPKIELCLELENPPDPANPIVAWEEHYSTAFYPMGLDERISALVNKYSLYA